MYLVCDGGGTKTEYMLFDLSGHIHGFSKTQGTNAIFINPDAAADAVCGGISDCLQQAGIRDTDLNEICLFIPGFKNSANAVRDRFPKTRLMVLGDEYNAYYGALGEPGGIAVLSGTGSSVRLFFFSGRFVYIRMSSSTSMSSSAPASCSP